MAENTAGKIKGRAKAAMLLGFFPDQTAKRIIRMLTTEEKDILADEITRIEKYNIDVIQEVVEEYLRFMNGTGLDTYRKGEDFAKSLFAGEMMDEDDDTKEPVKRIYSKEIEPFGNLKRLKDVRSILTFLNNEDSQTIAIIASFMKENMAAELLESLNDETRLEVAVAIAKMDPADKDTLIEIEEYINKKLANLSPSEMDAKDGVQSIVKMLNYVKRNTESKLLEQLNAHDPELAKQIKDKMFVFEDIVVLDKRSIQTLVSAITDNELIAKALRIASEELKEAFYTNMAQAKKALVDDINDGLVGLKRSDCEEAQKIIADKVKELADQDKITLVRGEEDIIV